MPHILIANPETPKDYFTIKTISENAESTTIEVVYRKDGKPLRFNISDWEDDEYCALWEHLECLLFEDGIRTSADEDMITSIIKIFRD